MRVCPQCGRKWVEGEAFCPFDGARLRDVAAAPTLPDDPLVNRTIDGRYLLERVLGKGGMGTVYAALQTALDKRVAVKVLRPVQDDDGQAMGRFEREARSASRLGNDHIIDVFDFGKTTDGMAFLVMEMLVGEDLGDLLERHGSLPVERAMPIVLQCCEALGTAHAAGIVHRALKPENVYLVERDGRRDFVKVVDFGLAKIHDVEQTGEGERKLTKTGMIFGTPHYMSPEQCMGKPTDHRSDIYSLGVILYELLGGEVPFDGETFMGVLNQHMVDPPPPIRELNPHAQVPLAVEAVVYRCLDKRAGNRPQSMGELADELLAALRESGYGQLARVLQASLGPIPPPSAAMALTKRKPSVRPPPKADAFAATEPVREAIDPAQVAAAQAAQAQRTPTPQPRTPTPQPRTPTPQPRTPTPQPRTPTPQPRAPRVDETERVPHARRRTRSGASSAPRSPAAWFLYGLLLLLLGGAIGYGALVFLG